MFLQILYYAGCFLIGALFQPPDGFSLGFLRTLTLDPIFSLWSMSLYSAAESVDTLIFKASNGYTFQRSTVNVIFEQAVPTASTSPSSQDVFVALAFSPTLFGPSDPSWFTNMTEVDALNVALANTCYTTEVNALTAALANMCYTTEVDAVSVALANMLEAEAFALANTCYVTEANAFNLSNMCHTTEVDAFNLANMCSTTEVDAFSLANMCYTTEVDAFNVPNMCHATEAFNVPNMCHATEAFNVPNMCHATEAFNVPNMCHATEAFNVPNICYRTDVDAFNLSNMFNPSNMCYTTDVDAFNLSNMFNLANMCSTTEVDAFSLANMCHATEAFNVPDMCYTTEVDAFNLSNMCHTSEMGAFSVVLANWTVRQDVHVSIASSPRLFESCAALWFDDILREAPKNKFNETVFNLSCDVPAAATMKDVLYTRAALDTLEDGLSTELIDANKEVTRVVLSSIFVAVMVLAVFSSHVAKLRSKAYFLEAEETHRMVDMSLTPVEMHDVYDCMHDEDLDAPVTVEISESPTTATVHKVVSCDSPQVATDFIVKPASPHAGFIPDFDGFATTMAPLSFSATFQVQLPVPIVRLPGTSSMTQDTSALEDNETRSGDDNMSFPKMRDYPDLSAPDANGPQVRLSKGKAVLLPGAFSVTLQENIAPEDSETRSGDDNMSFPIMRDYPDSSSPDPNVKLPKRKTSSVTLPSSSARPTASATPSTPKKGGARTRLPSVFSDDVQLASWSSRDHSSNLHSSVAGPSTSTHAENAKRRIEKRQLRTQGNRAK